MYSIVTMSINEYRTCYEGLKYVSKSKSPSLSAIAELRLDDMRERVANNGSKHAKKLLSEIGVPMQLIEPYNEDNHNHVMDLCIIPIVYWILYSIIYRILCAC